MGNPETDKTLMVYCPIVSGEVKIKGGVCEGRNNCVGSVPLSTIYSKGLGSFGRVTLDRRGVYVVRCDHNIY